MRTNIIISIILPILICIGSIYYAFNFLSFDFFGGTDGYYGTTLTTINGSDKIKDLPTTLNANFTALNNGKIEISTTSLPLVTSMSGLATIGTITSGTWQGTKLGVQYGGTGWTNITANALLLGNGTGALATTTAGSNGMFLTLSGGVPTWASSTIDQAANYNWTGAHAFSNATTSQWANASTTLTSKGYVDYVNTSQVESISTAASSTTGTGVQTYYATTTTTFTPATVTVYYKLGAKSGAGSDNFCVGHTTFTGTTATAGMYFLKSTDATVDFTDVGIGDASSCGGGGGNQGVAVSVNAVSSTYFVIKVAYTDGATWAGGSASWYAVAYK